MSDKQEEILDNWEPKGTRPESYTEFFKDRLREELNETKMVGVVTLASIVATCDSIETYTEEDPSKFSGQFDFREWITASYTLREHGYEKWGNHKQAKATLGDWQLDYNGIIQKCQTCHNYAFRNDINKPKEENSNVWTCTECKTDFVWPTTDEEDEC